MRRQRCVLVGLSGIVLSLLSASTTEHLAHAVAAPVDVADLQHAIGSATPLSPLPGANNPDVPVAPTSASPRAEPAVTVPPNDPDHVIVAMNDYDVPSAPRGTLYVSRNGGRTFAGPVLFPLLDDAAYAGDPSLASGPGGHVYFSFAGYGATGAARAGGIYLARSTDGGLHWSQHLTRVARSNLSKQNGRCHFEDKDEVTVDPRTGDVYDAWTDYNYDGSASCGSWAPAVVARSTDGGRHFTRPIPIAPKESTVGAMPRVGPDGSVYVAYTRYVYDPSCGPTSIGLRIEVARSTPELQRFAEATAVPTVCGPSNPSTTGGTYRMYSFPSFEVLPDGTLVLATIEQAGATESLVVVRSTDDGRTWRPSATPAMQPGAQYQFARLAKGPHGILALGYVEQQPGGLFSELMSSSRDGGRSWATPTTVSSEMSFGTNPQFQGGYDGDYNGLAIGSDLVAHPAWTDIRTPAPEVSGENIWTRRIPLR